jgi:hypothetical protein
VRRGIRRRGQPGAHRLSLNRRIVHTPQDAVTLANPSQHLWSGSLGRRAGSPGTQPREVPDQGGGKSESITWEMGLLTRRSLLGTGVLSVAHQPTGRSLPTDPRWSNRQNPGRGGSGGALWGEGQTRAWSALGKSGPAEPCGLIPRRRADGGRLWYGQSLALSGRMTRSPTKETPPGAGGFCLVARVRRREAEWMMVSLMQRLLQTGWSGRFAQDELGWCAWNK